MAESQGRDAYFILEATTLDELITELDRLGIDPSDLQVRGRTRVRREAAEPAVPAEVGVDLIREVADALPPVTPQPELPPLPRAPVPEEAIRTRVAHPGAALRRFREREQSLLAREAPYVYLDRALRSRDTSERAEAVSALADLGQATFLARVAQLCPHAPTRRLALEALARLDDPGAMEEVALFTQMSQAPPARTAGADGSAISQALTDAGDDYDEIRNLAVDCVAEWAREGRPGSLDCLVRLARYDFTRRGHGQFRAVRRLGDLADALWLAGDVDALVLLYNKSRNSRARARVLDLLASGIDTLIAARHEDALVLLAEHHDDAWAPAEAALEALERAGAGTGEAAPREDAG